MGEVVAVVVSLESDEIAIGQAAKNLLVLRQRLHDVGRRARRMEKKADLVAMAARAQLARQQHQMIVVDPHDVIFPARDALNRSANIRLTRI